MLKLTLRRWLNCWHVQNDIMAKFSCKQIRISNQWVHLKLGLLIIKLPKCSKLPPLNEILGSESFTRWLTPSYSPRSLSLLSLPLTPLALSHSPYSLLLLSLPCPLSLPLPLGPSWDLRKPCEPSEAFGSLWCLVRLRGLAPPYPPLSFSLPLASLCAWASQGPWDLPGASGSLGSLWQLGLQSDSGALLPLIPLTLSCFLLLPLTPLDPEPPWAPGTLVVGFAMSAQGLGYLLTSAEH